MRYITTDDIRSQINDNILRSIIGADQINSTNPILVNCETLAINTINSYLINHYDMDTLWLKKGIDRDQLLINIAVSLMLYFLSRRNTLEVNEIRIVEYNNAIQMLKDIRDFKISPQWPTKSLENNDRTGFIIYNNNIKSVNDWDY